MDERESRSVCRSKLRYPSDLTDEEWSIIGPVIPPAKRGGNKRTVVVREVVNGADVHSQYRLSAGLAAKGLAAAQHGERLFLPVEL